MRNAIFLSSLILLLPPLLAADEAAAVKLPPNILTNQGIVLLSDAGYGEDFLVDLIRTRPSRFDTSAEGLAYLAQHGICEHVVRFMVARVETHEVTPAVHVTPLPGTFMHIGFPLPQPAPLATRNVCHHSWLFRVHCTSVPTVQPAF